MVDIYTRIIRAQVTASAKTDVFVGHGSTIVTVLSAEENVKNLFSQYFHEKNDIKNANLLRNLFHFEGNHFSHHQNLRLEFLVRYSFVLRLLVFRCCKDIKKIKKKSSSFIMKCSKIRTLPRNVVFCPMIQLNLVPIHIQPKNIKKIVWFYA